MKHINSMSEIVWRSEARKGRAQTINGSEHSTGDAFDSPFQWAHQQPEEADARHRRLSSGLRKSLVLTALFLAFMAGSAAGQVAAVNLVHEIWTPREWQPKLLNWNRDLNQNFVEDGIETMNPTNRINIVLDLNDCPLPADLERFARFGKLGYVGRYITVICLTDVQMSDAVLLAKDERVAMVELDHQVHAGLDISVRNMRVRASATYSPNTVQDMYGGITGMGVNIAILDTGADDGLHESLPAAKFVGGYDAFTNTEGNPDDDNGHGTHVAATALGTGGAAGTYRGVAQNARLVDIKVLDSAGNGTAAGLIAGIEKCIQRRTDWNIGVANISIGDCNPSNGSDAMSQAVNRMAMADIVPVVIMYNTPNCGLANNLSQVNDIAAADDAIVVAASDDHNAINRALSTFAPFSFTGPRMSDGDADTTDEMKPDVTAPGTAIISAQFNSATGYVPFNGTSQAAPHVAGLAALIRQAAPTMRPHSIRKLIRDTAEDKGPAGYDNSWGYGLVNGFAALNQLFTSAKTDLRFVQNCSSPDPMNWLSADLFPVAPAVVEGTPNVIQANIQNNGVNVAVNYQVRLGVYGFSNGQLAYNICTINRPGPLLPGATDVVSCPWNPGVIGLPPGIVHACLKGEIVTPFDTDYVNNCAQHNIDIQQTSSPARFRMRVHNPTGHEILVVVTNDLRFQENWTLEQSSNSFVMPARDCPVTLELTLTPRPGVIGTQAVNIHVRGISLDSPDTFELSGVTIMGFTPTSNAPPASRSDSYNYVPGTTLSVAAPGVLGNDLDSNGDPLSAVLVSSAEHGAVMLLADGSFGYTPEAGYNGSDAFVYQATDGRARSFETIVALNAVQVPKLEITLIPDDRARICWPAPSAGYVLQCTTNLTNPIFWQEVNLPIVIINGNKCVVTDTRAGAAFYRLCQPTNLAITELSFDQADSIQQCEILYLTASAYSPNSAILTYSWSVLATPPGANVSFTFAGNKATFSTPVVGSYTLQVKVIDNAGQNVVRDFNVDVGKGLLCNPLQQGEAPVQTVSVGPIMVSGAPFPPFPIDHTREPNEGPRPRVPNGPLRGNLQPSVQPMNLELATNEVPGVQRRGLGAADPVVFGRSTGYGRTVTFSGTPPDMSGAANNRVVLTSGNTWGALSTDAGQTFSALNPTTIFPGAPVPNVHGGMCCDQVVQYVPSIDRFIWLMQFWPSGPGLSGQNMLRVASASTAQMISSGGTAWTYWDLQSSTFGLGNNWMDYPDMSVGDNYLYISVDRVGLGLLVMRMPLSQIQASSSVNIDYTDPANSANAYFGHLTQRTGNAVYWAGHISSSRMRIWNLPEGSNIYSWRDVEIDSWPSGSWVSLTPSGVDWLNGASGFNACIGATRRNPSEIWFAWNAPAGGGFSHPHIQMVRFNAVTYAKIQQMQIWNGSHAYAYPALVTNTREEVGMALMFGGGNIFEGSSAVGIWGDFVVWTPGFSTSSDGGRVGDYLAVRQYPDRDGVLYSGSVYNRVNLGAGEVFNPIYILFGRRSDAP